MEIVFNTFNMIPGSIKKARIKLNLTLREASKQIGVNPAVLSIYENETYYNKIRSFYFKKQSNDLQVIEKPDYSEQDLGIAERLQKAVIHFNPEAKIIKKANIKKWANEIKAIRDSLDITHEELEKWLQKAFADSFWKNIIQSPGAIKKHWDKITSRQTSEDKIKNMANEIMEGK